MRSGRWSTPPARRPAAELNALSRRYPAGGPPAIPVYPHYPYKAGHYPTTEAYYDLPPYADINPNFYRWRYFLMAQERNRYRYVPHIFHRFDAQRYE